MGIRETLNKNPSITTGVTIGIIVVALICIIWQSWSSRPNIANIKSFYTVDDGKTWFEDQATLNPPFDHNGQPAVRVFVFKCPDGKEFAAYMERYTPDALAKIEKAKADPNGGDPMMLENLYTTGMEVKKVGGTKWVLRMSPESEKMQNDIKCPDGTTNGIEPVVPGQ